MAARDADVPFPPFLSGEAVQYVPEEQRWVARADRRGALAWVGAFVAVTVVFWTVPPVWGGMRWALVFGIVVAAIVASFVFPDWRSRPWNLGAGEDGLTLDRTAVAWERIGSIEASEADVLGPLQQTTETMRLLVVRIDGEKRAFPTRASTDSLRQVIEVLEAARP
jgi:hypothetical protein